MRGASDRLLHSMKNWKNIEKFKEKLYPPLSKRVKEMRIVWIWMACLALLLEAGESKKYNLSICAIFKNEAPYLKEWIEYHKLIGVDHFYLYNNLSLDAYKQVLNPYILSGYVTLVQWLDHLGPMIDGQFVWPLSTQVTAYENAAKWMARKETRWLLFLDIDEFLVPSSKTQIDELLKPYSVCPGIVLESVLFDASSRGVLPPRKLVIEAVELTSHSDIPIERSAAKIIVNPDRCAGFTWPPYKCLFEGGVEPTPIPRKTLKVNRYQNRMRFQKLDKIKKISPVDSTTLSEKEQKELFTLGYEIEDPERAIYRFMPDLYKKMGLSIEDR